MIDREPFDSQADIQEGVRDRIQEFNKSITRPFYVFDSTSGLYYFIYLDEGNNPNYNVMDPFEPDNSKWLESWHLTIQDLVNYGVEDIKEGLNPF